MTTSSIGTENLDRRFSTRDIGFEKLDSYQPYSKPVESNTMASNTQLPPSKAPVATPQTSLQSQPQQPPNQVEGFTRRSGGCGSFGAGASTRVTSAPRNGQSLRKQHRGTRPKLASEDSAVESAAIRSASSRKGQTSITHLMNFSLPPRPQTGYSHLNHNHGASKRPTWGLGSGYHAIDKARYIHANYRFIVDPRGEYAQHAVDPDVHLDWNNVLQILASAQFQSASCPICLSFPIAPRMAKCGHIFCLSCLIRYMHSGDDSHSTSIPEKKVRWKACPICWDSIHMTDMRPVRFFQGKEGNPPKEGDDVVLRLMIRQPGSMLALPRDNAEGLQSNEGVPWYFTANVIDYGRIMKGSEGYMLSSYDREIDDIRLQEQEDQVMFGEEDYWTKKAISTINDMKEKAKGIGDPMAIRSKPNLARVESPTSQSKNKALHSSLHEGEGTPRPLHDILGVQKRPDTPFYFYQALLHYYLSPLDIRILRAAFGDYSTFPATILPRVEHVSTGHIVDDELRRRAKYLGHLPRGCEVGFLECDWTDIVPSKILEQFYKETNRRIKRNRDKEVREEKERIRAEREEDEKRWAAARRKRPSLSKARDESPPGIGAAKDAVFGEGPVLGSSAGSSSPPWSFTARSGSAFASLASPSTSPNTHRTVWGTAAIAPISPQLVPVQSDFQENDGWLQNWEQDLVKDGGALVDQLEANSHGEANIQRTIPSGASKKKKSKKITLMSTNARRGA